MTECTRRDQKKESCVMSFLFGIESQTISEAKSLSLAGNSGCSCCLGTTYPKLDTLSSL